MTGKITYPAIDRFKFIFAFFVVAIHVYPLTDVHWLLNFGVVQYLARLAVPFFFTATGFFLVRDGGLSRSRIINTAKKLGKLYLVWSAVYFPASILRSMEEGLGLSRSLKEFVKKLFLSGSYGHLWYLHGVVVALLLVLFVNRIGLNPKIVLAVGTVLYLVGLLGQSWYGLGAPFFESEGVFAVIDQLKFLFGSTRNGLMTGFVFVYTGVFLAQRKSLPSVKKSVSLFLVSLLLLGLEILVLTKLNWIAENDAYLFLLPCNYFLFSALCRGSRGETKPLHVHMRVWSGLIYFSHLLVYEWLLYPLEKKGVELHSLFAFGITALLSFLFSAGVFWLSKRKGFDFLKHFYA